MSSQTIRFALFPERGLPMLKKWTKRFLGGTLRLVPLDTLLFISQQCTGMIARSIVFRDWRLQASGQPQFFKHQLNLALWRSEPARWSFTARGVYARGPMFRGCSVLDLCCGDGSTSYLFFSDIAGHIDAVDNDTNSLKYARRNHAAPAISYHQIDIISSPLPARRYDFVVWNAAICYFAEADIRSILEKIVGVGTEKMVFSGMLPKASGYIDHKTEFEDRESVEALLKTYFDTVTVFDVDEISTRTFYFRASNARIVSMPDG